MIVRSGLFDHTIAKLFDTYRRMEFQNRDGVHVSYVHMCLFRVLLSSYAQYLFVPHLITCKILVLKHNGSSSNIQRGRPSRLMGFNIKGTAKVVHNKMKWYFIKNKVY